MVPEVFARAPLATDRVRFVGEPVALVIAESPEMAADAAELVGLDLDPLVAVVDADAARTAGRLCCFLITDPIWPTTSRLVATVTFLPAARQRSGAVGKPATGAFPMEPDAILVVPESGRLTVRVTSQTPFGLREAIASSLGMAAGDIHVIVGDMGGGFGAKAGARPELIVVAAAARRLGRPVKWIETRSENLVGMTHGRGQVQNVELGATRDGKLIGMRARVVADVGAYPGIAILLPFLTGQMSAGVYEIPAIDYEAHCVVTNTTPVGAYRGAGRPEAAAMVERAMDMLAVELGIDPAELRRRGPDRA